MKRATCHPDLNVHARGLCTRCYRAAFPAPPATDEQLAKRLEAKVDRSAGPDACHPWRGPFSPKGIPSMFGRTGTVSTRRVAWFFAHGFEPHAKQWIRPACGNHACLNPKHLILRELEAGRRFWSYVDKSAGPLACWPWIGGCAKHRNGYGEFHVQNGPKAIERKVRASRFVLELVNGVPVPADRVVMHLCDNPICVNPAHLRIGTHKENHDDMTSKGRHPIIAAARARAAERPLFSESEVKRG